MGTIVIPELLDAYARKMEGLVLVLGPRPRSRLLLTLRGLGLGEEDAAAVIEHALASRRLEVDPADPAVLRVRRESWNDFYRKLDTVR